MTFTLYWAFAIVTYLGGGASCSFGIASSPDYADQATCEAARAVYEADLMQKRTPTRRISTMRCEEKVRRP